MFKYFLSMTALMISVAGIGVSLAREEFRCYLGLVSAACNSSEVKSTSPTEKNESIFNQEVTKNSDVNEQENLKQKPSHNAKSSDSSLPQKLRKQDNPSSVRESFESDSKFISVEELSRIPKKKPNVNLDNSIPSGEEGYVGIPIKVEPFSGENN